jgi:hypothetical protein
VAAELHAWSIVCRAKGKGQQEKIGFSEKGQKLMLEFQLRRISAKLCVEKEEKGD